MHSFADFVSDRLGTKHWCVAARLSPRHAAKGYTVAVSPKRFAALQREWEIATHGAPLASLHDAAPDLLRVAKWAMDRLPDDGSATYAAALETIWRAEDRGGYRP